MTWEERGKKIYESSGWGKKGKDIRDRLEERTKRTGAGSSGKQGYKMARFPVRSVGKCTL
mgnify:CR=1 FL=1